MIVYDFRNIVLRARQDMAGRTINVVDVLLQCLIQGSLNDVGVRTPWLTGLETDHTYFGTVFGFFLQFLHCRSETSAHVEVGFARCAIVLGVAATCVVDKTLARNRAAFYVVLQSIRFSARKSAITFAPVRSNLLPATRFTSPTRRGGSPLGYTRARLAG